MMTDANQSNTISLNEFLDFMIGELRERKTNKEYAAKFTIYDQNKDGYITA